jgi:hypothetical protein
MRCRDVQLELSARMDGELRPLDAETALHADTCAACRAFADGASRVRAAVRFAVAEPIPDLVSPVMERVRAEPAPGKERAPVPRQRMGGPGSRRSLVPRLVAAALAGVFVGVAVVSGGLLSRRPSPSALATEVPRAIARSAAGVKAYRVVFRMTELNWRPEVPERTFIANVVFRAPESMRVTVRDLTDYPESLSVRNESRLIVDGATWSLWGPRACTPQAAPTCAALPPMHRVVTGRPPFDADAPMPTDVVLPVTSLGGSERVEVLGGDTILGRDAVHVRLSSDQAVPLLAFFQQTGSWRPHYPADPVDVWLDRDAWLPLRFEVRSAGGPDRDAWAAENGIPHEPAGALALRGDVTDLGMDQGPGIPHIPTRGARDRGFREATPEALADELGWKPAVPRETAGLPPHRSGRFAGRDEAVTSFARGLSWLRVHQTRSHRGDAPFGAVGPLAERVVLPGGSVAFYEPAGLRGGRRLAIHARATDVYLESNLPRDELLRVAGSLRVRGLDLPRSWRVRTGPDGSRTEILPFSEGVRRAPFGVVLPRVPGMRPAAAELRTGGAAPALALYYRRPGIEVAGFSLRLYQAPGEALPPPSGTDAFQIELRGTLARWSPGSHTLEWREGGAYRSITAPGLGLDAVARIAESLEPAPG